MSSLQSAVRSHAEAVQVSRTVDWMILFIVFTVVIGSYHIHAMLTMGDWDFWSDWKDRRLWATVTPIVLIAFPAAVQSWLWEKYRLPWGATVCVLALLMGEWINRYGNFWMWTYFPVNFVFPSQLVPGAIILDMMLLLSGSYLFTAIIGGMGWGLIFYPGNWPVIAPLHVPVEYNGMLMSVADIQGYNYVRTGTPKYIRMVEKGTLRTFGKDAAPVSAFFSGLMSILIYFLWHFLGIWLTKIRFRSVDEVLEEPQITEQTIIATSSRGIPDYLRSSLDRAVLIEQVRSPSQQCDELLSLRSQAQELLTKLKTRVRRRRFEWIFVSVAGLAGAILSAVLADLWKPWSSELFALVPIVLGAVVWFFATLRASVFARRKALLEFDSKVLEKYIKTRLELLES